MMIKYEKIVNDDDLPIKLVKFHGPVDEVEKHWHNSIEIIVPVSGGRSICWLNGNEIEINASEHSQTIIINSQSIHAFSRTESGEYSGFALQINYHYIKKLYPQIDELYFESPNQELSDLIRKEVYSIDYYYRYDSPYRNLIIYGSIANILFILFDQLSRKRNGVYINKSEKNKKRISAITNYIDENYFEDISLESLAQRFELSKQHLLKLFRENIGTTVKVYLTTVRLHHAVDDLIHTDLSLLDIAYKNGFPNLHALNHAVVEKYNMTSTQYRKKMKE